MRALCPLAPVPLARALRASPAPPPARVPPPTGLAGPAPTAPRARVESELYPRLLLTSFGRQQRWGSGALRPRGVRKEPAATLFGVRVLDRLVSRSRPQAKRWNPSVVEASPGARGGGSWSTADGARVGSLRGGSWVPVGDGCPAGFVTVPDSQPPGQWEPRRGPDVATGEVDACFSKIPRDHRPPAGAQSPPTHQQHLRGSTSR
nr:translation initiation factor IF-2-like [Desmodus rotundus]